MKLKEQILLLVEEEELDTSEKIITAIKHGRVPGIKPDTKIDEEIKSYNSIFNDFPSIYKNAAIKLALKRKLKYGIALKVRDAYYAYFNNRNKKEAKTTYKQLFTDFEEGKVNDFEFEKKVNEIFKDKAVGKADADKLYEDDTWLMVIPKTFAASCKYGEGTKWCTTSSKSIFDGYSNKSPLIIIINKKTNKKYQVHSQSDSFMDETDKEPENIAKVIISFPSKIQELLKQYKFNIWNKVLINASKSGKLQQVKQALDNGADVHAKDDAALKQASIYGHTEIVKLLLDKGADVHADNDISLKWASANGHVEVVKLLLDKGANIHSNNDYALFQASIYGHAEVVKLLLDKGANIHAENDIALRQASEYGQAEIVKLLLDRGADVHADNDYVLYRASKHGYTEIVKLLLDKGANVRADNNSALYYATKNGHTEIVKLLKQYMEKK